MKKRNLVISFSCKRTMDSRVSLVEGAKPCRELDICQNRSNIKLFNSSWMSNMDQKESWSNQIQKVYPYPQLLTPLIVILSFFHPHNIGSHDLISPNVSKMAPGELR